MSRPSLSVVIATLGRPERLRRALGSLEASDVAPAEVLVVDAAEDDAAERVVAASAAPFSVRLLRAPRGSTVQRNAGVDAARGDVVLFLDDDARPRPDAVRRLLEAFADPAVVGATGRVVEPASNVVLGKSSRARLLLRAGGRDGTFTRFGYPRRLVDEGRDQDVEFMQGCFMAARTALAREVRFDERLGGYALAEDEDFACRLARRGRVRYLADAVVDHDNAGFKSRDRYAFGRLVVRNRTYLFRKNFPQTRGARAQFELFLLLLVVHRLLNADGRGALGVLSAIVRRSQVPPLEP